MTKTIAIELLIGTMHNLTINNSWKDILDALRWEGVMDAGQLGRILSEEEPETHSAIEFGIELWEL